MEARSFKAQAFGWLGLSCTFSGLALQAAHTSADRYSFLIFLFGNAVWITNGCLTRNRPLVVNNIVAMTLNVVAAIRWFT